MIFTLKVTLLHGWNSPDKWEATLEIDSMSPLDELHFAIQDVLEFDDDHLYEFFIARTAYSRDRRSFDDENGVDNVKCMENLENNYLNFLDYLFHKQKMEFAKQNQNLIFHAHFDFSPYLYYDPK